MSPSKLPAFEALAPPPHRPRGAAGGKINILARSIPSLTAKCDGSLFESERWRLRAAAVVAADAEWAACAGFDPAAARVSLPAS